MVGRGPKRTCAGPHVDGCAVTDDLGTRSRTAPVLLGAGVYAERRLRERKAVVMVLVEARIVGRRLGSEENVLEREGTALVDSIRCGMDGCHEPRRSYACDCCLRSPRAASSRESCS